MLCPAKDKVTTSRSGRDLRARSAILLPDPTVHATVDNLEMGTVDILVDRAICCISGVDVRRNIATTYFVSQTRQHEIRHVTYVAYLNEPCTFAPLGQNESSKLLVMPEECERPAHAPVEDKPPTM